MAQLKFNIKQSGFRLGGSIIRRTTVLLRQFQEQLLLPLVSFAASRDESSTPSSDPNVTRVAAAATGPTAPVPDRYLHHDLGQCPNHDLETYSDKIPMAKVTTTSAKPPGQHTLSNHLRSFPRCAKQQQRFFLQPPGQCLALNFPTPTTSNQQRHSPIIAR